MRIFAPLLFVCLICSAQKHKEPKDQVLPLLKDPPAAVTAETGRLVFHVSPLSAKGLLSQQVRDGLKDLLKQARDSSIVKLRAFTAGSGDIRRVQAILSETFADRHLALPALSVAQVGGLPLTGAQVVIESVAVAKKPVNPHGLAFISGLHAASGSKSVADLRAELDAGGLAPADVVRVSCFLDSLEDAAALNQQLHAEFPAAAVTLVQIQRVALAGAGECEAVARLRATIDAPVKFLNPRGAYSQMVLVNAPKLALTGSQLAFGSESSDVRLAFQRLDKDLEPLHTSLKSTVMAHMYALSNRVTEQVGKVRFEFYDKVHPPAGTILQLEGLPAMDANFAVDVIAVAQ